jgi:FlaA1/EpsC-like NDP-sugar epimerase
MIKLSGLEVDKDIKIKITGLRPGEKLYEELLNDKENTMPTHHDQIMIAKINQQKYDEVNPKVEEIIALYDSQDNQKIVAKIKELIPEYKSNNSEFELLD